MSVFLRFISVRIRSAEQTDRRDGRENDGPPKLQSMKLRDVNLQDRKVAAEKRKNF